MEQLLYTVSETSTILKVNKNAVYELLKKKKIQGLKLGSMKIPRAEIVRFIEENVGKDLSDLDNIKELSF